MQSLDIVEVIWDGPHLDHPVAVVCCEALDLRPPSSSQRVLPDKKECGDCTYSETKPEPAGGSARESLVTDALCGPRLDVAALRTRS
jgi:hypothetical protein